MCMSAICFLSGFNSATSALSSHTNSTLARKSSDATLSFAVVSLSSWACFFAAAFVFSAEASDLALAFLTVSSSTARYASAFSLGLSMSTCVCSSLMCTCRWSSTIFTPPAASAMVWSSCCAACSSCSMRSLATRASSANATDEARISKASSNWALVLLRVVSVFVSALVVNASCFLSEAASSWSHLNIAESYSAFVRSYLACTRSFCSWATVAASAPASSACDWNRSAICSAERTFRRSAWRSALTSSSSVIVSVWAAWLSSSCSCS
mmetsp:Transcript_26769/g.61686  ORF Transcript_26769/g.61686 Transcript_26769/m.61686 type:complete len:268 (-) Transcript_26769:946-1749(-)